MFIAHLKRLSPRKSILTLNFASCFLEDMRGESSPLIINISLSEFLLGGGVGDGTEGDFTKFLALQLLSVDSSSKLPANSLLAKAAAKASMSLLATCE